MAIKLYGTGKVGNSGIIGIENPELEKLKTSKSYLRKRLKNKDELFCKAIGDLTEQKNELKRFAKEINDLLIKYFEIGIASQNDIAKFNEIQKKINEF